MNITYRKRENGKIQAIISYKVGGKWQQKSKGGFTRKKDAQEWAEKAGHSIIEDKLDNISDGDITLDRLFDMYIQRLEQLWRADNTIKSIKSAQNYFNDLSVPINKLTPLAIEQYMLSHGSHSQLSYIKRILNFAVKNKMLRDNPAQDVTLPKHEDKRIKFISKDLYRDIIEGTNNNTIKLICRIAYETGMRIGEIYGITVDAVHTTYIDVNKQYLYKAKRFSKLKTKNSNRQVPISIDLYHTLKNQMPYIDGRIIYNLSSSVLQRYLRRYKVSPHIFRHTAATNLISAGIDLSVVSAIIGDNIQTIMSIYAEINQDKKDSEFDRVRKLF